MRSQYDRSLDDLRDEILRLGSTVEEALSLALKALAASDVDLAQQVVSVDAEVNAQRYDIEHESVKLIATQQPAAGDLRRIVAVMNMIVDLERMGDKAKGIAASVSRLEEHPELADVPEIRQMGEVGASMLNQCMTAYARGDVELARTAAMRDDEIDELYLRAHKHLIQQMAETEDQEKVRAYCYVLGIAQSLERFADLVTNVGERIIYIVTGTVEEMNPEPDDTLL